MTGIEGFDEILDGGFIFHRLYLIEGNPGAGKTTLALQFLLEGARRGEKSLYLTLCETRDELNACAASHGWALENIAISELIPGEDELQPQAVTSMFHPAEIDLIETSRRVMAEVERVKPDRIVIDSLSELRLQAQDSLRYRRQLLALKQFFTGRKSTVIVLNDRAMDETDTHVRSIADGVVVLEQLSPEFGAERRRLRVVKLRAKSFRGGYHDYRIRKGGIDVFPRLVAAERAAAKIDQEVISSGIAELDALSGGGLERGTSTILMGPAGTGKSSVALQYALTATSRGQSAAIYSFDESFDVMTRRARMLGMPIDRALGDGSLTIQQVDPAELSPGEFATLVRSAATGDGNGRSAAAVIIIDSLNGYLNAMPEEKFLILQLHELLTFLGQNNVATILVTAQHGLLGTSMHSPVDTSYLADTVVLFRYFESRGEMRKCIAVVKKRSGAHEKSLRELRLVHGKGIEVGGSLEHLQGVLTGVPTLLSETRPLLEGGGNV